MKYVEDYCDPDRIRAAVAGLRRETTRPWTLMEICGGQTHTIARHAIEDLLPDQLELVHGPGCPVCVTPMAVIEKARRVALDRGVVLCTFGDMMRVPGPDGDLLDARARGADVRIVLTPLDALRVARENPDRDVVLFAVGFETTAPTTATTIRRARELGLDRFTVLAAHVRVPPAIELILSSPGNRVQAFLAAGHVCTITGVREYPRIAERFGVPIVVTGFEPLDILIGVRAAVRQLEAGAAYCENRYARSVRGAGNELARADLDEVFEVVDREWRGIGTVPEGGFAIRERYGRFDADRRHEVVVEERAEPEECRAAEVLQGRLKPFECAAFGRSCTPDRPLGAPMVSSEGACAAYHRYRGPRGEESGACRTKSS